MGRLHCFLLTGGLLFRRSSLHWYASLVFLISLFPLFYLARLPFRIDLGDMASAYWLGATVRAVFCATLLYVLAFPWRDTIRPVIDRFCSNWWLPVVGIVFVLGMMRLFGLLVGIHVIIYAVALAELMIH